MGQVNIGIDNLSPQHIDRSYGRTIAGATIPYLSVAAANAAININFRHKGKTVLIDTDGTNAVEYWWKDGTADVDLIVKQSAAAGLVGPFQMILTTDDTFLLDEDLLIDKIIVIPTVAFDLKIGYSVGADDIMPEIPMLADQANVINVDVVAWGEDVTIYFTGIPATTTFLIYRRTLVPINL